ncbi:TonB-dependent receptor [Sulfurimonas sp.]|uniref:TonB-dependent receptor n=1 Tax=Sulfurimonas sp. TaxID=2022749 RepID=UPI002B4A8378|nr:TonB-dependent receptor [Sulfurimonas sp.]
MKKKISASLVVSLALCLSVGHSLFAQDLEEVVSNLDTITVTADKREVDIQKIPTSLTVYSCTQLEDFNIKTAEELFSVLPNIHLVKAGPAADIASSISIRGISQFMAGSPSFGFYIDDVYYNEYDSNLFDIQRIELLRGPQGTLYGRNTIGGVLNIITKKPDNEWTGKVGIGYGNYNTSQLEASVSGPIIKDKLLLRLSAQYEKSDGFVTNKYNGDDKINSPENIDSRLSLRYLPTGSLMFDLGVDALRYKSGYADYVLLSKINSNPHEVDVDYAGNSLKEAYGANLRIQYDAKDTKLISVTAVRQDNNKLDHDMDFTTVDGQRQLYQRDYFTLSEELRLVSDNNTPLEWLVGAYALKEVQDHNLVYTLGNDWGSPSFPAGQYPITGKTNTIGLALFGELSYTTINKFKFTTGMRYDREKQDFYYDALLAGGAKGNTSATFKAILPKFSASFVGDDKHMPYLTISKGYKSGGFNLQNNQGEKYDPEYTWNYELGLKLNWLDNRLSLNTAIYHIDWQDLQVNASNGIDFLTTNAGKATSQGIEFELNAKPKDNIEIVASFAYTKSKYDEYYVKATSSTASSNFSNKYLPFVPNYTSHLGMTYKFINGFYVNADYTYTGHVYMNNTNTLKEDSFSLVNAKVGFKQKNFEVSIWTKNLLDKKYATVYTDFTDSGGGLWARAGAPMTFGIQTKYKF